MSASPIMPTVFHARPYDRFMEIKSILRRKKLYRTNRGSNFLGGSFRAIETMSEPQSNLKDKGSSSILNYDFSSKRDPSIFNINSTRVTRPVNRNKLSFSSIEINKPLTAQDHSVSSVRLKLRRQLYLLLKIRVA